MAFSAEGSLRDSGVSLNSSVRLRSLSRISVSILGAVLLLSLAAFAEPAEVEHPRLVSAAATSCTTCHEELFEGRGTVHAPAREDCGGCHEVTIAETGTRVALVESEPALCLICHDDLAEAAAGDVAVPHYPVTDSCLTCHEVHAGSHPALLAAPKSELCGGCHAQDELNLSHGDQITDSTDCSRCHQPHGSDHEHLLRAAHVHAPFADGSCQVCHRPARDGRIRLRSRGEKLCTSCHGDLAAAPQEGGSVHAAMHGARRKAACLNCHDPHMSLQPGLILAPGVRLCEKCHQETVGQALAETGHAPAADDCLSCHLPHTSDQERLLNEPPATLCLGCHDPADEDLIAAHLGADPGKLDCTTCHSPHGAGQPHLLANHVHPPVLEGCDTCHDGGAGQQYEEGGSALCLMCHEEIGEAAAAAVVPHAALEVASCADCHNPHASAQEHLVSQPGGGECLACHEEQAAGPDETAHGVIDRIGCRACHEPHGGSRPKLLRAVGAELCLACHEPSRAGLQGAQGTVRLLGRFEFTVEEARAFATLRLSADGLGGHPIPNHRVLGRPTPKELKEVDIDFEGEMTCLTCHDPHKGKSNSLLLWDAVTSMQACNQCHAK